jgi:hypothetical protein
VTHYPKVSLLILKSIGIQDEPNELLLAGATSSGRAVHVPTRNVQYQHACDGGKASAGQIIWIGAAQSAIA